MQQEETQTQTFDWEQWWTDVRKTRFGNETPPRRSIQIPNITAHTWVILDGETGRLIWGKNEHSTREVASITKTMTAYVVIRLIEQLKIDPFQTMVEVSEFAATIGGTLAQLQAGDQLLLIDLLYGLMLPSGNDAALTLAENFGQSKYFQVKCEGIQDDTQIHIHNPWNFFVQEMNQTSQRLGLSNTYFSNPHGLPNRCNRSTAYDMAKLCFHALKHPLMMQIVRTKHYNCTIRGQQERTIQWKNTNKLLDHGFMGVKTGQTNDAGPCLASMFKGRKHQYIVVVLNCENKEMRWVDSCKLIDWVSDIYDK